MRADAERRIAVKILYTAVTCGKQLVEEFGYQVDQNGSA